MSMRGLRFEVARVVIEARTPFLVGTGRGDDLRDEIFVADANGLPTIPGTTLAGLLRHAVEAADGTERAVALFGFQESENGAASRVEVSFAQLHGDNGAPVPFLGADLRSELLGFLANGMPRDHVRIDARGVADDKGKFDELLVPTGARFTFEILLHSGDPPVRMGELLSLIGSIRIGAHTRRGHGVFRVVSAAGRAFDLTKASDRAQWVKLPRSLSEVAAKGVLETLQVADRAAEGRRKVTLQLRPRGYWMFGGGTPHRDEHRRGKSSDTFHDRVPVTEKRVVWNGQRGEVAAAEHIFPASSLKGALRHRVAFHARRLSNAWAEEAIDTDKHSHEALEVPEVVELFGTLKAAGRDSARPGRVFIDDGIVKLGGAGEAKYGQMEHVSLDRLTQGPMDGLLFGEAPLHGGSIEVAMTIEVTGVSNGAREAFAQALADLCEGRLAIGAGGNKGFGFSIAQPTWSDGGRWVRGES
ncbi:MAG: hypothetical protein HYV07_13250 [Deltaproteobacteria bacterium]|nr:hypothetical protein [Deltaproteobacteria bacterium]